MPHLSIQVDSIYSLFQASTAIRSSAAVLQVNVGRLREWHSLNPNVIVDPHGPRQDSGAGTSYDPGIHLVEDIMSLVSNSEVQKNKKERTRIIAGGLRNRQDCLLLAGME